LSTTSRPFLAAGPVAALTLLAASTPDAPTDAPAAASAVASAAQSAHPSLGRAADVPGAHRQYGPPVEVGEGMARTHAFLDAEDGQNALELGVALDEGARRGVPSDARMHVYDPRLPARSPAPNTFVQLDWNAHGHPGWASTPTRTSVSASMRSRRRSATPSCRPTRRSRRRPQIAHRGRYPTAYRMRYDAQADEYRVALAGLAQRR